ncbi:MAG: hypothetical protein M3Q92_11375 [Actinomycetota bacterium]|nr:hypothetical protein [Actinomycetota bacterium]
MAGAARRDDAEGPNTVLSLEGKSTAKIASYASEVLRIKAGENAIRKAPATSVRLSALDQPERAVRSWLHVDTDQLDLFTALVRVRSTHVGAYGGLDEIAGVVQVLRLEAEGDLLALVLYEQRSDRARLRARLEELGEIMSWEVVSNQSVEPALATWRALTKQAAEREGLLAEHGE